MKKEDLIKELTKVSEIGQQVVDLSTRRNNQLIDFSAELENSIRDLYSTLCNLKSKNWPNKDLIYPEFESRFEVLKHRSLILCESLGHVLTYAHNTNKIAVPIMEQAKLLGYESDLDARSLTLNILGLVTSVSSALSSSPVITSIGISVSGASFLGNFKSSYQKINDAIEQIKRNAKVSGKRKALL